MQVKFETKRYSYLLLKQDTDNFFLSMLQLYFCNREEHEHHEDDKGGITNKRKKSYILSADEE